MWKTPKGTVVTSLTFHPAGHMLLIATSNNILFWDWSQPQPFAECATRSVYEKVRSVHRVKGSVRSVPWVKDRVVDLVRVTEFLPLHVRSTSLPYCHFRAAQ